MIRFLLQIPLQILYWTLSIGTMLCLTIIGIPIGLLMIACGLGLALAVLAMLMIPIGILMFA